MMGERKKYRALLLEPIHADAVDLLSTVAEVSYSEDWEQDTLVEVARDVDGIIVRANGRITPRIMDAAPRLVVVARHGVGVDNVDVAAAAERGIYVVNAPGTNSEAVAEHCVGMMIALSRHFLPSDGALRQGRWTARQDYLGWELRGKTLGIVGFGHIGRCVATICRRGFDMSILYCDVEAYPQAEQTLGAQRMSLHDLLREVDYVSVHAPLLPETQGLIGDGEFALMKPTAIFLNLARGPIVDEGALIDALREGTIAGAGLDVFTEEPTPIDNPLLTFENVVVTPHMAGMTQESMLRMAMAAVRNVMSVWEGKTPQDWVNRSMKRRRAAV